MDIYEKWKDILDSLNVTDNSKRKIMAEYAEFHTKKDIESQINVVNYSDIQNLLPVSLKILSKLNLTGKNVVLKDGQPTLFFSEEIEEEQLRSIKESYEFETVIQLENILVEKISEYINKELETKNNLYITLLVQSISIISEEHWKPRMMINSRMLIE